MDVEFARDTSLAATDTDEAGGSMGGSISGKVAQTELTDRQLAVLELIKRDPHMPYRKMAEELGINDSAVKKHLDKLKAAGAIERIGGTRGYWKVKV